MAIQTPAQWLASQQSGNISTTNSNKKNKVQTPAEWLKTQPEKKKTLGGKIVKGVGDVAKAIASPVVTTVARPFQAAAMLGGASTENIDKFTLGGLIAPTPKTGKDVLKDVGRGIQTVALGLPTTALGTKAGGAFLGASKLTPKAIKTANLLGKSTALGGEGAVFGLGAGLEQGEVGKNIALGAGIGAALPIVGAGISKVLGKTASKTASKVAPKVEQRIAQEVPTPTSGEGKFIQPKPLVDGIPTQAIPEQPIQRKIPDVEYENIKSKIDNDYTDYKDYEKADEFVGKDPEYITQTIKGRQIAALESTAVNGIDNSIDEALGKKGISPDAGYTASAMKEFLIKSGKLNDDQVARLLRSKAVESMAGSSLQSVSPLQSFISKANEAIKQTYQKKIVANKKTVRNLFEGLEC